MAAGGYVKIYSNDGSTLLFTSTNIYSAMDDMTITETGVTLTNEAYTYSGDKKFLGLSSSANATEANAFAVGYSGSLGNFTFYIVEANSNNESIPTSQGEIYYKGNLVATIVEGETIVLHTKDFKFLGDIVIKNVGEVEEETPETPTLISFTIRGETYQAEERMTWKEWIGSSYNPTVDEEYEYYYNKYSRIVNANDKYVVFRLTGEFINAELDDVIINGNDYTVKTVVYNGTINDTGDDGCSVRKGLADSLVHPYHEEIISYSAPKQGVKLSVNGIFSICPDFSMDVDYTPTGTNCIIIVVGDESSMTLQVIPTADNFVVNLKSYS
jgi:hypothetical protein